MDFIRPELRAAFYKWREVMAGVGLAVMGLWALLDVGGLVGILGGALVILAVLMIWTGAQRVRFRQEEHGLGSVDVDEGQVTYFGPLTGGAIALRDMESLSLIRAQGQTPHWRLSAEQGVLHIPVDADGTDALFDAFSTLSGLRVERMLTALRDEAREDVLIWQRNHLRAVPGPSAQDLR